MKRDPFVLKLKPGMKAEYKRRHDEIWPEMLTVLEHQGCSNYSIWAIGDFLFGYREIVHEPCLTDEDLATVEKWNEYMKDCYEPFADSSDMQLMYSDIGIVREDKSLIRHRVFCTHLKPGCAAEYKRRHDELAASRGGVVKEGPESNFTIWRAKDYIFGYCELVKSFDHEETPEEHAATVAWESRGLEIMDWVTDDVDWLTGEKHVHPELMFTFK